MILEKLRNILDISLAAHSIQDHCYISVTSIPSSFKQFGQIPPVTLINVHFLQILLYVHALSHMMHCLITHMAT
jgi:hypothetical protein